MDSGIALLLGGSSADLSAILHAIELARRTTGIVHVVFLDSHAPPSPRLASAAKDATSAGRSQAGQLIALTSWLGNAEEVVIHIHHLQALHDGEMINFIREYRIFCLIVGADDRGAAKRHANWLNRIRHRLAGKDGVTAASLWSVITEPWDAPTVARMITGLRQSGRETRVIESLAEQLQTRLDEAETISFNTERKRRKRCTCTFR
ncbi:MAG: hypothetical protein ACOY3Z_07150 [Thermodesulfobacteriota bacterium]